VKKVATKWPLNALKGGQTNDQKLPICREAL
jgi:hypothetical protein